MRIETPLQSTPDIWYQSAGTHISAGTTTFNVGTTNAGHYAVGDKVFLELGDDPFDAEPWDANDLTAPPDRTDREWIENWSGFATVQSVNTTAGTVTIDSASAPPFDIDPGDGSVRGDYGPIGGVDPNQNRPNRIRKVTVPMVENIWLNNLAGDFINSNPDGGFLVIRANNVLLQNISGFYKSAIANVDSDDVTVRGANVTIDPTTDGSHGRVLSGWNNDRTLLENSSVTVTSGKAVIFRESHDRNLTVNGLTVNWQVPFSTDPYPWTRAPVLMLTSESNADFNNVVINNAGYDKAYVIDTGGSPAQYDFGHLKITGPVLTSPMPGQFGANTMQSLELTTEGRTYHASPGTNTSTDIYMRTYTRTYNLNSTPVFNEDPFVPSAVDAQANRTYVGRAVFTLNNTLAAGAIGFENYNHQGGNFSAAGTYDWNFGYGSWQMFNTPNDANALRKYLWVNTTPPPSTTLQVTYYYWIAP